MAPGLYTPRHTCVRALVGSMHAVVGEVAACAIAPALTLLIIGWLSARLLCDSSGFTWLAGRCGTVFPSRAASHRACGFPEALKPVPMLEVM